MRKNSGDLTNSPDGHNVRVALCMNCIIMQQALTMANTALRSKMHELHMIHKNGQKIKLGLALNDLALESLEKRFEEDNQK